MKRETLGLMCLLSLSLLFAGAGRSGAGSPQSDARDAAVAFLRSLPEELLNRAKLSFDSPARTDWQFVPGRRAGVTMGELDEGQRAAARSLLRSALSSAGTLKVETIMSLDSVLRDLERAAGGDGASRDPAAFAFAVFGDPAGAGAWGWRVEGHHVSLNFTVAPDGAIAVTPAFLGANPAEVRTGVGAGRRALAAEEDIGRELLLSLDESQRREATIAAAAPSDILTAPGRDLSVVENTGLPAGRLTPGQLAILKRLLAEYTGNLRYELAEEQTARMNADGIEGIRFAWAGSDEKGRPHYYRVTGPSFIIEYDNTQNGANHIHTVWHDRTRDFGRDLLKEHYDAGDHDHVHGHAHHE